jgi:hypothetical protein
LLLDFGSLWSYAKVEMDMLFIKQYLTLSIFYCEIGPNQIVSDGLWIALKNGK